MVTKKIKFFAALAVASLVGLTSCSNNNEVTEGIDNGKEKSVFLKIEQPKSDNNFTTRAELAPAKDNAMVEFKTGNLFFTGPTGIIVRHYEITAGNDVPTANSYKIGIETLNDGYEFKNLPSTSKDVHVVGNTVLSADEVKGSIKKIINKQLAVESQSEIDQVNLYGHDNLHTDANNLEGPLVANVTLAPIVSRLELTQLKAKGDFIKSFRVSGVFVDNYLAEADLDGKTDIDRVVANGSNSADFVGGAGNYTQALDGVVYDYYSKDKVTSVDNIAKLENENVWGYNVFAKKGNGIVPHLVIRIEDIKTAEGDYNLNGGVLFLTVKMTVKGKALTEIEPSKIYSIGGVDGIIFDETNLTPNPNEKALDAKVTVTLATWNKIETGVEL